MFSANEDLEELATENFRFLHLPVYIVQCLQRLGGHSQDQRPRMIEEALRQLQVKNRGSESTRYISRERERERESVCLSGFVGYSRSFSVVSKTTTSSRKSSSGCEAHAGPTVTRFCPERKRLVACLLACFIHSCTLSDFDLAFRAWAWIARSKSSKDSAKSNKSYPSGIRVRPRNRKMTIGRPACSDWSLPRSKQWI